MPIPARTGLGSSPGPGPAGGPPGYAGAAYRSARTSFSPMVSRYNSGFGSQSDFGRGDGSTSDRPFQLVGKGRLNLLDPLSRRRESEALLEAGGIVQDEPAEGPLGFIEDYYDADNPAGLVGGLIGALGQTVGGIFGQGGAKTGLEIGSAIGKTLDVPFNLFSSMPLPTMFLPFIDDVNAEVEKATPYLFKDIVKVPKTAGDIFASGLNALGLLGRGMERTFAGLNALPGDLQSRVDSGEIDRDRAYDMMVMEGRGYSDNPIVNLIANIALDPLNWATLGIGAVGGAVKGSLNLAKMVQKGGEILNVAEHGAVLGHLGDLKRANKLIERADIEALSRVDAYRLRTTMQRHALSQADRNPLVNLAVLARTHLIPSAREVLGTVDPKTTSSLFYKSALKAIQLTDPITFLGGRLFGSGNIGKRQMELLATTGQAAVFSSYGDTNIRRLAQIANSARDGGGENTIMDALGVHAANTIQEYALDQHIADGMQAGKVPILSDANGHSLSATEAARGIARLGAFDINIGKHLELLIQKQIPALLVRRAGETEEQLMSRLLAESRAKMQSLLGPTWDPNSLKASDLNEKMAALIHAAYYYGAGAKLHTEVLPALARHKAAGGLAHIDDPTRLTMLAERQLTTQRAEALAAAVTARNATLVRQLIQKYKNFDWLDGGQRADADLLDDVGRWLDANKGSLPREVDLRAAGVAPTAPPAAAAPTPPTPLATQDEARAALDAAGIPRSKAAFTTASGVIEHQADVFQSVVMMRKPAGMSVERWAEAVWAVYSDPAFMGNLVRRRKLMTGDNKLEQAANLVEKRVKKVAAERQAAMTPDELLQDQLRSLEADVLDDTQRAARAARDGGELSDGVKREMAERAQRLEQLRAQAAAAPPAAAFVPPGGAAGAAPPPPAGAAPAGALPKEAEDWLRDADAGFGYTLAEAPPANIPVEALYGAIRDGDEMLMGMNPWLDFLPNPETLGQAKWSPNAPSRMRAYLSQATQHVRQERIRWEGQRRFITDMSKGSDQKGLDVAPAVSQKIWRAIMSEAEHQRVQPRGLGPDDMARIVRKSIEDGKKVQDGMSFALENLSHHQVMNALLRATKGDLWTVGGTQWFTGRIKANAPGSRNNFWGRISENLFPQMRFSLNPVFQLQELAEPYILNRMRGVSAPLDRNSEQFKEALATHNAIMQLTRTSLEPDGMMAESAEYLKLYAADYLGVRQNFGPQTIWGRVSGKFRPGIGERKAALAALEARANFGDRFYRTGLAHYGEEEWARRWSLMEHDALSLDKGEVAMKWMAMNMHIADNSGQGVTRVIDLLNPQNFGPRMRIVHEASPGAITFKELEDHIDGVWKYDDGRTVDLYHQRTKPDGTAYKPGEALVTELKGMTEQDWMLRSKGIKNLVADDEALRTVWRMANAPPPKDFWAAYRKAFLQQVKAAGRGLTRKARDAELENHQKMVRIFAQSEGITEAEYIARHFQETDYIQTLSNSALVPGTALLDMRPDWLVEAMSRTDFEVAGLMDIESHLDGWRAGPEWENAGDYNYKVVSEVAVPTGGGKPLGMPPGPAHRGWGELDAVLDMSRQEGRMPGATLVRLPKTSKKKYKWLDDTKKADGTYLTDGMDTNEMEVFDVRKKQWRQLGEMKPWMPEVPDFKPVTEGARGIYVPRGTPDHVVGLHPVDINAYLDLRHGRAREQYKGDVYAAINTYLRGIDYDSGMSVEQIERMRDSLNEIVARGALPEGKMLYRGVNLSRIEHEFPNTTLTVDYENLMEGDVISDPAFQSFTDELETAGHFAESGGHVYEKKPGQLHKSVYIHLDAPPGMNVAYLQGREHEHLLGEGQKLSITKRVKTEFEDANGVPTVQYDFYVTPTGYPKQPRVNRLGLEELTPSQQVGTRLSRDAITDPEKLRLTVDERFDDVGLAGGLEAEAAIRQAEKNLPPTERTIAESLNDDLDELDPEDIAAVSNAIADVRLRMQNLAGYDDLGMRMVHALSYAIASEGGMSLGWKEVIRRLEGLWNEGVNGPNSLGRDSMSRALFKGIKSPQRPEPLEAAFSDALDVMLGNRSRRAVGRGELDEPVIVDQFAMMEAGYPEGTVPNEFTHEYVVDFFNRKAREANATNFAGRGDWSASEMALLSQRKWQYRTGKSGIAVDPAEVDSLARTLPVEVYPAETSTLAPYAGLIDILFQRENREQLNGLMDELGLTIGQQMRDKMGFPVLRMDGAGLGLFDDGAAVPMVPVGVISSDARAEDAADVLAHITGKEVHAFHPVDVDDMTDLLPLTPRIKLTIPDQGSEAWTQQFASSLARLLDVGGTKRGATAHRLGTGDWAIDIIDEEGVFRRLDDGSIDKEALERQLDSALDEMDARPGYDDISIDDDYGTAYHAMPDTEDTYGATASRLAERGSRLTGEDLDSLRSTFEQVFRDKLHDIAPKQARRARNGEPLVPGILEDRRGGSVRGYTDINADSRAIIAAVGQPDPLTGLHELVHVHARTLDPSGKGRVIAAYDEAQTLKRGDLQTRIDALRQRAAGTSSASWRTRWTNDANALEAQLGGMSHQVDWGTEHEEFLVDQFMRYIHQGRAANPEMGNVMEHFRTWTERLKTELFPDGHAISPEMTAFFDQMFRKKTRDMTVPYSLEHETFRMAAKQQLRDSWDEAHGTHYYRKDRRWFERTVNHPYLGVYPASYMWGKVLPEMFRFLALRPFGYESPLLAWNVLREVSETAGYQAETNAEFKTFLKDNERAFMLFSMLFPAVPNDISSNASLPIRRISEQALGNAYKNKMGVEFGDETGQVHDINYLAGLEDAAMYAIGPLGAARTAGEVMGMVQGGVETATGARQPEEINEGVNVIR